MVSLRCSQLFSGSWRLSSQLPPLGSVVDFWNSSFHKICPFPWMCHGRMQDVMAFRALWLRCVLTHTLKFVNKRMFKFQISRYWCVLTNVRSADLSLPWTWCSFVLVVSPAVKNKIYFFLIRFYLTVDVFLQPFTSAGSQRPSAASGHREADGAHPVCPLPSHCLFFFFFFAATDELLRVAQLYLPSWPQHSFS